MRQGGKQREREEERESAKENYTGSEYVTVMYNRINTVAVLRQIILSFRNI